MKLFFATLAVQSVSIACVICAAWMAVNGKEGWGWFLFVAVLAFGSVTIGGNDK